MNALSFLQYPNGYFCQMASVVVCKVTAFCYFAQEILKVFEFI